MHIISKKKIVEYYAIHADAQTALEDWYHKVKDAEWDNFAQVRETFNSADYVGNKRIVFNIRGNDYRLVALVLFTIKRLYIRFVGTHQEYLDIQDIENI